MITAKGLHRKVFIFRRFVVKFPRNLEGWFANINEGYNYLRYKDVRALLVPTYGSLLGLINVQAVARTRFGDGWFEAEFAKIRKRYIIEESHPCFTDSKQMNYGEYKGRLVKIDYGNWYWVINTGRLLKIRRRCKYEN